MKLKETVIIKKIFGKHEKVVENLQRYIADLESVNRELKQQSDQDEFMINKLEEELKYTKYLLEDEKQTAYQYQEQLKKGKLLFVQTMDYFLKESDIDYEKLYGLLAAQYDVGGWILYETAQKIRPVDIYREFYTEDCLGYFEFCNGYELLKWLKKAEFAEIEYRQLNCGYELSGETSFAGREKELAKFDKEIKTQAVSEMLKAISLQSIERNEYMELKDESYQNVISWMNENNVFDRLIEHEEDY